MVEGRRPRKERGHEKDVAFRSASRSRRSTARHSRLQVRSAALLVEEPNCSIPTRMPRCRAACSCWADFLSNSVFGTLHQSQSSPSTREVAAAPAMGGLNDMRMAPADLSGEATTRLPMKLTACRGARVPRESRASWRAPAGCCPVHQSRTPTAAAQRRGGGAGNAEASDGFGRLGGGRASAEIGSKSGGFFSGKSHVSPAANAALSAVATAAGLTHRRHSSLPAFN